MSSAVNLTLLIIFTLLNLAFGVIHNVYGQWDAEIQKCYSGGDDNRINIYNISDSRVNTLPDIFFDSDTVVQVGGTIELLSGFSYPVTFYDWPLYNYHDDGDVKSYQGEIRIDGHNTGVSQVAYAGFTLFISRDGNIQLQNYVYAGSWGSLYCATAKALINSITVAI